MMILNRTWLWCIFICYLVGWGVCLFSVFTHITMIQVNFWFGLVPPFFCGDCYFFCDGRAWKVATTSSLRGFQFLDKLSNLDGIRQSSNLDGILEPWLHNGIFFSHWFPYFSPLICWWYHHFSRSSDIVRLLPQISHPYLSIVTCLKINLTNWSHVDVNPSLNSYLVFVCTFWVFISYLFLVASVVIILGYVNMSFYVLI